MSETKFTPWTAKNIGGTMYVNCKEEKWGFPIVRMFKEQCPQNMDEAQIAHLIAAAPELYEALKFLLTCKHGEFCDHYREAETKARTVLAKLEDI